MTGIFEVLFLIVVAVLSVKIIRLCVKRLMLHIKITRLGRIDGVEVRTVRSPLAALFSVGARPVYAVRVDGTVFYVRIYNGVGASRVVHFASKEYTARFVRLITASYTATRGGKRLHAFSRGVSVNSRVIILPELQLPAEHPEGCAACEVLIFNPAPGEVSYVTEERTRIEVAFTGDEVHGVKIFTARTFARFVDRMTRGAVFVPKDVYVFDDIYNK